MARSMKSGARAIDSSDQKMSVSPVVVANIPGTTRKTPAGRECLPAITAQQTTTASAIILAGFYI